MFGKSLYIVGALAGALVWSAAAQAAPGDAAGSPRFIAVAARHYNEPLWLYDHIIDQTNPNVGNGRGQHGEHDFVGGMSQGGSVGSYGGGNHGDHGAGGGSQSSHGNGGEGHGGGNGGGHSR